MTKAAQEFVTPLAASALADGGVYTDLFDRHSEFDVGHIRLAREADIIVVAPCTADFLAHIALGIADDLASSVMLAAGSPVLLAPAMNPYMWRNPATQRNITRLRADGFHVVGPNAGEMAERGEAGTGRMAEPIEIAQAAITIIKPSRQTPLSGRQILITAGPTHEPIDPVRYIANRSSGKQGYAIARAAADAGAAVTLVSGPVNLPDPEGVKVIRVESAREMLQAVENALPADVAIFAAAVADWRVAHEGTQKIKKGATAIPPLQLKENPDILSSIAHRIGSRPKLVIGFAAETENVIANAKAKLARKGCDWILANDVSAESGVMGGDRNTIHLVTATGVVDWPEQSKDEVAKMLIETIGKEKL
jgi:phosphopantothenoylcysteine decarboxylase/phosphopantothenate--cysteine ligase